MNVRHRLAAICFADIVDYSRLSATNQKAAMRLVAVFEEAVGESIGRYGGRVVKFLGDGVLAEFPSVQGAIAAADALQRGFGERAVAAGFTAAALRVGIHSGEIVERGDGDVYGDGVNVAQRVQQAAAPGEIVVSDDAWRQGRQHAELEFEGLGERDLKGIGQVELYRVRLASGIEPESGEPEAHGGWETFVGELKRRHVFRVAAIYSVVAWLVVQVANATFGPLGVPAWVLSLVVVVALVGAPVVVALAWAFDWTAGGVRRTDPGALPPSRAQRLGRQLVATVAVLAAVPVGWVVFRAGTDRGMPAGGAADVAAVVLDPARLAVLYFDDRSSDSTLEHMAAGFTESIIDQLSGVEGLEVLSRYAVEPFRGTSPPPDSLARILGAGTLVDGSVERAGDALRVRIQLIDAADLSEIDSWTAEREMDEILSLQDELAAEVASALRSLLGERLRLRERREGTESVEAWELVRRAEALAFQARRAQADDPEVAASLRGQADALLARAESLDPSWVEPALVRAELAARSGNSAAYARGLEYADRALRMDSGSATALRLRGVLHDSLGSIASDSVTAARELFLAQRDLRAAVAADPGSAPAWIALADLLYNDLWDLAGARHAAGEAYENDAFLLEEDHFVWLCEISLQLADYPEAKRWCAEGLRRYPSRLRLLLVDLYILASPGVEPDPDAAWGRVEDISRVESPEIHVPLAKALTAAVLARAGAADSAYAVLADARQEIPPDFAPYLDYFEAYVRLILGERERVIPLLESFLVAIPNQRAIVARDVWFEDLHGNPRFDRLVDRRQPIFCRILCEPPGGR